MTYRKPNKQEQLDAWKQLAFEINLYRTVNTDPQGVQECLRRIDRWVNAHQERPGVDAEANVITAFWEQICKNPAAGLKDPPKPESATL